MTITTTEHCSHAHHFVPKEKITWLHLPNGGKRRICEDCKLIVESKRIIEVKSKGE